ncbi:glycosyltransferase [Nocardia takedensis]
MTLRHRSLHIAVLASNRHPIAEPFAGGLEAHVWHLSRALRARGHRVTLFAAPGSDPAVADRVITVQNFRVSALAALDPSMPTDAFLTDHHAYLALMTDLMALGPASYDVVHNHSLHYLPVAMAPALPIPMLTTLHTPPTPWLESALEVTKGAGSAFAAVSRHTAATWSRSLPAIEVITNGIDTDRWPAGPGGSDLVWFGRITPEKGTHLAIEAAARVGRTLHLAGPLSDRRYFEDAVAPRLGPHVRYHGHLAQDELARLVGDCGVALITPRWDEPYGLVVAEALACGTPVAAFARGGIPEIVDTSCARLAEPDDLDSLAAAAESAAELPRHAARRRARTHCGYPTMLESYLRCYHRLLHAADDPDGRRVA